MGQIIRCFDTYISKILIISTTDLKKSSRIGLKTLIYLCAVSVKTLFIERFIYNLFPKYNKVMKLVNLTNGNSKSVFTENMSLSEKFKIEQKNFMTEFFEKFITISHHMNYFIPREEIFEYLSEYGILTNRFPPERLMIINFFKKKQILSERKCMNGTYIYLWPYIQWTRDEESGQKIIDRVLNTEGDSNDSKTAQ